MSSIYSFADKFFFIFHVVLILFNVFGWIFKPFRKWNLITLLLTAFSWTVLGIFYGFGYCFLTDWHWEVREKLGYTNESNSYIHFLISELTGISLNERVVDIATLIVFIMALSASVAVNIRWRRSVGKR